MYACSIIVVTTLPLPYLYWMPTIVASGQRPPGVNKLSYSSVIDCKHTTNCPYLIPLFVTSGLEDIEKFLAESSDPETFQETKDPPGEGDVVEEGDRDLDGQQEIGEEEEFEEEMEFGEEIKIGEEMEEVQVMLKVEDVEDDFEPESEEIVVEPKVSFVYCRLSSLPPTACCEYITLPG